MTPDATLFRRSDAAAVLAPLQGPMRWGPDGVSSPEAAFSLPVGTVTFLLTDVEGSTRLWSTEAAEAMRSAVARHVEILDGVIAAHGGVRPQEQGEGDSIVAAFARPSDALRAARDAQLALAAESWPTIHPLRVRMAVHTGEAQLRDSANYAGQAIIRTARLRGLGHGGQVLVSNATRDLAVDQLGDEIELRALGEYTLRDLGRPELVWQLVHRYLQDEFAPLTSAVTTAHNLPTSLTPFIGRLGEIATLARLVSEERVVTATGSGGAGKTRLAQQVGAEVLERFPSGVWWVELAPLGASELENAVAAAVGLRTTGAQLTDAIINRIGDRPVLLVLDNCEHVLEAARALSMALLAGCGNLHILATSRSMLDLPGELAWRVPPMGLPIAGAAVDVSALSQYDAVTLFIDRARRARPNFTLDDHNAPAVAEICTRLDGLPLAIELAAARSRMLPPTQILDGLTNSFRLLTGGSVSLMPRQQTLEASIAWSFDLLGADEKLLLQRLSVFVGGFTLEAAEGVCADALLDGYHVFDRLDQLIGHSLVQADDTPIGARFRLLETIRQFSTRLLAADPNEAARTSEAHARWFATSLVTKRDILRSGRAFDFVEALRADDANTYSACSWLIANDPELAVRLIDAISPMIMLEAGRIVRFHELSRELTTIVTGDPLAIAWYVYGITGLYVGATDEGLVSLSRAAAVADEGGLIPLAANARCIVASMGLFNDEPPLDAIEKELTKLADAGDPWFLARALSSVAMLAAMASRTDLANRTQRALADMSEQQHPTILGFVGSALVEIAHQNGRPLDVLIEAERALTVPMGDVQRASICMCVVIAAGNSRRSIPTRVVQELTLQNDDLPIVRMIKLGSGIWRAFADDTLDMVVSLTAASNESMASAGPSASALGETYYFNILAGLQVEGPPFEVRLRDDQLARSETSLRSGDLSSAAALADQALRAYVADDALSGALVALEQVARVLVAVGESRDAARILGACDAFREERQLFRFPFVDRAIETSKLAIRADLGDEAGRALTEGRQLSLEAAIEFALRQRSSHAKESIGWASLTPTESRVAELVANGRTNREVGAELLMSPETVKTHLSRVFTKLGITNRRALSFEAAKH